MSLFTPGPAEVVLVVVVLAVALVLRVFTDRVWRWVLAFCCCLFASVVITPADPFSALLLVIPLFSAFVGGVVASSSISPSTMKDSN